MTLKSILIDNNKTKAIKLDDDKVQVDVFAIPVDEKNDIKLSVKVNLYINGQLFENLQSDMDGWIKRTLVVQNNNSEYLNLRLQDISGGIKSKIKNILILDSQKENIEKKAIEAKLEKNEILSIVSKNGKILGDEKYKKYNDDKEIVMIAVKQNGLALQFVSENLKNDESTCLEAVKQNGLALEFVSENLKKNNLTICLAAVNQDVFSTKFIPKNIVNDEEILKVIFQRAVNNKFYLTDAYFFWIDHKFKDLIDHPSVSDFATTKYEFITENKDFVLSLMKKRRDDTFAIPEIFNAMGKILRDDKDIMAIVINNNISYLDKMGKVLSKDEEFIIDIIKEKGVEQVENYLTEDMKNLPGVNKLLSEYKKDKERKELAVARSNALLEAQTRGILNLRFNNDREVVFESLKKNINNFKNIGGLLAKDEEFLLDIIKEKGVEQVENYLTEDMKNLPGVNKILSEYKKDKERKELAVVRSNVLVEAKTRGILDVRFNDDREVVFESLKRNINNLNNIGSTLKYNEDFIIACMTEFGYTKIIKLLSEESKSLPKIKKIITKKNDDLIKIQSIEDTINSSKQAKKRLDEISGYIFKISRCIESADKIKIDINNYLYKSKELDALERKHPRAQNKKMRLRIKVMNLKKERSEITRGYDIFRRDLMEISEAYPVINVNSTRDTIEFMRKEDYSGYNSISGYVVKLGDILERLKKELKDQETIMNTIQLSKNKIKEMESNMDKI